MAFKFHGGKLAVQGRAGTTEEAARILNAGWIGTAVRYARICMVRCVVVVSVERHHPRPRDLHKEGQEIQIQHEYARMFKPKNATGYCLYNCSIPAPPNDSCVFPASSRSLSRKRYVYIRPDFCRGLTGCLMTTSCRSARLVARLKALNSRLAHIGRLFCSCGAV